MFSPNVLLLLNLSQLVRVFLIVHFLTSGEQNAFRGSKKRKNTQHIMSGRYKYKDIKWIISDKERRKSDDCCKKCWSEVFILMK